VSRASTYVRVILGRAKNATLNSVGVAMGEVDVIARSKDLDDEDRAAITEVQAELERVRKLI
jgi:hypothetical protein